MDAETISWADFERVSLRVGTVVSAHLNPKARVPAIVLEIDFGPPLGTKTSSARITRNYSPGALVGRQVVAVTNLAPKRIAGVRSEVLVLGAVCEAQGVVLLEPSLAVANGSPIG